MRPHDQPPAQPAPLGPAPKDKAERRRSRARGGEGARLRREAPTPSDESRRASAERAALVRGLCRGERVRIDGVVWSVAYDTADDVVVVREAGDDERHAVSTTRVSKHRPPSGVELVARGEAVARAPRCEPRVLEPKIEAELVDVTHVHAPTCVCTQPPTRRSQEAGAYLSGLVPKRRVLDTAHLRFWRPDDDTPAPDGAAEWHAILTQARACVDDIFDGKKKVGRLGRWSNVNRRAARTRARQPKKKT